MGDLDAVGFQVRAEPIERRGIRHLPAEEADALAAVLVHDQALLAIVHAQRERRAAAVDRLQAQELRAVARPVVDVLGAEPDIAERWDRTERWDRHGFTSQAGRRRGNNPGG